MLYWAILFFVVAIVAAVFGFGGIASASAGIAQILFFIFLVLFVVANSVWRPWGHRRLPRQEGLPPAQCRGQS